MCNVKVFSYDGCTKIAIVINSSISIKYLMNWSEVMKKHTLPTEITIFPPENANTEVTDEDSGDEEYVFLQNLPGSQLRNSLHTTPAEIPSDEEDDSPLASLAKRRLMVDTEVEDNEEIRTFNPIE